MRGLKLWAAAGFCALMAGAAAGQDAGISPPTGAVCAAPYVGEEEIRVAALIHLAGEGLERPAPTETLVDALEQTLITCEAAAERQLIANRIRVLLYRTETKSGLKVGGQADYDPAANAWFITEKGFEEVAIWRRRLAAETR